MRHDNKNFDKVNLGVGGKVGQKASLAKDAKVSAWQFSKPEAFSRSKEEAKAKHPRKAQPFPPLASVSALCISWASEERGFGDFMTGTRCSGELEAGG